MNKNVNMIQRYPHNRKLSVSHTYLNKLGLGGHRWSRMDPQRYAQVVQTALDQGMRLLEAGQEGGDRALAAALKTVTMPNENEPTTVTVTTRLGYRTLSPKNDADSHLTRRWDGDVTVEKQTQNDNDIEHAEIVHNMSPSFLSNHLSKLCPLFQEESTTTDSSITVSVVPMIHNPEVQIDWGEKNPQDVLYEKLVHAFREMEEAVANHQISSFGVVSNGLALPATHPLHLDYKLVLRAAQHAADDFSSTRCNLSMLQLPANVFEPMGFQVARNIQSFLLQEKKEWPMDVVCMRPLTWYPEQGTGASGNAISLVDYSLPNRDTGDVLSTLTMEGPPLSYQRALNQAMSHFDGTALLEQKKERDLTGEERETLEGCKLLQSVLHDLDVELSSVSSFAAYERELVERVIPTLYGRFEELDEESAQVLQNFFSAHGQAVRYAIATRTRDMLVKGDKDRAPYEIPSDVKLQEFALGQVLKEDAFQKVIVGCTHPAQVMENVAIAKKVEESQ